MCKGQGAENVWRVGPHDGIIHPEGIRTEEMCIGWEPTEVVSFLEELKGVFQVSNCQWEESFHLVVQPFRKKVAERATKTHHRSCHPGIFVNLEENVEKWDSVILL